MMLSKSDHYCYHKPSSTHLPIS